LSFLYWNGKKGKRAGTQRDRESVCARDGALLKMEWASILKTAVGERINYFESSENQHIKITFFLGNYFNGRRRSERYIKITKIGIIFCGLLATFGTMTFHVCFPYIHSHTSLICAGKAGVSHNGIPMGDSTLMVGSWPSPPTLE
jgi:hypothetical protein